MKSIIFALFCIFAVNLILPSAVGDISDIALYGSREDFNLSARQARVFAETVISGDYGMNILDDVDAIYPVLLDISGDGIPLLLLVGKTYESTERGDLPLYSNILYGYADGRVLPIKINTALGIMQKDGENLLSLGWVTDFGGSYHFYRVQSGTLEYVSTMRFVADWHGGTPHGEISIDGVPLSPEEYWERLAAIPTIRLMDRDHPGFVTPTETFRQYLSQAFTVEQIARIFLNYAVSLE